jgi:hypothetical protein
MHAGNLARRAPPNRAKRERMIAPALLFAAGLARLDRVEHEQHRKLDVRNVRYRDGLMMAILAARAFRLGNSRADARRPAHQQDRRRLLYRQKVAALEQALADPEIKGRGGGDRAQPDRADHADAEGRGRSRHPPLRRAGPHHAAVRGWPWQKQTPRTNVPERGLSGVAGGSGNGAGSTG